MVASGFSVFLCEATAGHDDVAHAQCVEGTGRERNKEHKRRWKTETWAKKSDIEVSSSPPALRPSGPPVLHGIS